MNKTIKFFFVLIFITIFGIPFVSSADWGAGGNITYDGNYTIHTFYTNGTFTAAGTNKSIEVLIVGGGGGAGKAYAGGGGAGGVVHITNYSFSGNANVIVGLGGSNASGADSAKAGSGGNSSFGNYFIAYGGGGGSSNGANMNGVAGGSGGGGAANAGTGGASIQPNYTGATSYGNSGGTSGASGTGAGGGGAGQVGGNAPNNDHGGYGGNGTYFANFTIAGSPAGWYGGGGGGTAYLGTRGWGGLGGGGNGSIEGSGSSGQSQAVNGTGGGGAAGTTTSHGTYGGTGIVIIRYKSDPVEIINSAPANGTITSSSNITFSCNLTKSTQNITNIVLNVSGPNSWNQTISGLNTTNYNASFINETVQAGTYTWNCIAFNDELSASSAPSILYKRDIPIMIESNITLSEDETTLLGWCNATSFDNINLSFFYSWYQNDIFNNSNESIMYKGFGGNITYNGDYIVHTFTTDDNFTIIGSDIIEAEILIVAGGGAGGARTEEQGGGGGAGGLLYASNYTISSGTHTIDIGIGGISPSNSDRGLNGENSSFDNIIAFGGGGGGASSGSVNPNGKNGGSGGGTGNNASAMPGNSTQINYTGFLAYGNIGGQNGAGGAGGGGGGAGTPGGNSTAAAVAGAGGNGTCFNITGTTQCYAGGGGAGYDYKGVGGLGGGGNGSESVPAQTEATDGINGTGGGGGGEGWIGVAGNTAGSGGSGIVIIRYKAPSSRPYQSGIKSNINNMTSYEGEWILECIANDGYYNSTALNSSIITITQMPIINLTFPQNNSYVNNPEVNFTYNITAYNNLTNSTIYVYDLIGNLINHTVTTFNPSEGILQVLLGIPIALIDGTYVWLADAWDVVNKYSISTNYTFILDSLNPQIEILYPLDDESYNYIVDHMNVSYNETYPDTCWYSLNNGTTNTTYTCNTNITSLTAAEGPNTWVVYANDSAGNYNFSSVTFIVDTIDPSVNLTSPANGTHINNLTAPQEFTAVIYDFGGIANITYRIYNETSNTIINETLTTYEGNTSFNYSLAFQPLDGRYIWFLEVTDLLSNTIFSENRTLVVDNEIPDIEWIYPPEGSYLRLHNNTFAINVSVDDIYLDAVNLSVTNQTGDLIYNNFTENLTEMIFTFTDTITFSEGNNTIEVCGRDSLAGSPKIKDKTTLTKQSLNLEDDGFLYTINGVTIKRTTSMVTKTGSKEKKNDMNLELVDTWDKEGKHIKTDINFLKFKNKDDKIKIVYECVSGCKKIEYLKDRGVDRLVDNNRNLMFRFDDAIEAGWKVDYSQVGNIVEVYIYSPSKNFYDDLKSSVTIDPIAGGLNTNCENVTLEIDSNASIIYPIYPLNGTYIGNNTVNITYNITDDQGVLNTTVYVYNESGDLINETTTHNPSGLEILIGIPIFLIDGIYNWFADVWDFGLNYVRTDNQTFIIDTTTPTITITYPNTNYTYFPTELNYTFTEANPDTCWYNIDSGSNVIITCGDNVTGLLANEGYNIWNVSINDTLGLVNNASITFLVDTFYPTINYQTPTETNNSYLQRNNIVVNITANDTNLVNTTIWLYNNSGLYSSINSLSSSNYHNFTALPDNTYYFNASACDILFQCNYTDTLTVTVDTINPIINYSEPYMTSGFYVTDSIYTNVSAFDTNLANITIVLNGTLPLGGTFYEEQNYTAITSNTSFYYNFTGLTQGYYNLTSYAYDYAGRRTNNTYLNYQIDNEPPVMNYTYPTPDSGTTYPLNNFPINVTADDPNYANMSLYVYDSVGTLINQQFTVTKNIYITTQNLTDGIYYYNATSFDTAGNQAQLPTRNITLEYYSINVSACRSLYVPFANYIVTADLSSSNGTCLDVIAPNVNIDCQGHTIIGNAAIRITKVGATLNNCIVIAYNSTSYALKVQGNSPASIIIYNSTFTAGLYGIYMAPESVLSATNINVLNNVYGIYFNNSSNNNIINTASFSGNSNDTITIIGSDRNQFTNLTMTTATDLNDDGVIILINSTDNYISHSTFTTLATKLFNFTSYSVNNTLHSSYYDSTKEYIDGTSHLIRSWIFTGTVQDAAYNKLQSAGISYIATNPTNQVVNYSNGQYINYTTLGGSISTNSPGIATTNIIGYMNIFGTTYNSTPYNFSASYLNFAPKDAEISITDNTQYTFTLDDEIASNSLTRTVMWLILGIVFLIGIAASIGFFMVRMREGYSVVDIWKYFIILVIWLVIFTILFYVLAWFIMGSYYPQIPTL